MRISLVGYGKMGKAIEKEAIERGHIIALKIDIDNQEDLHNISASNTDVTIEFTHPGSFRKNLTALLQSDVPIVSGTTGWYEDVAAVKAEVNQYSGAFMYASNFSIGVNILFKINRELARLMNPYAEYDCFIEEQHHRYKKDAPSGTAVSLAQQVIKGLDRKTEISTEALRHRAPLPEELSVGYIRSGEIRGRHKVSYTSEIDTVSIEHHAHNRRGFALGAVIAAEWMQGKKGFYDFAEIF